MKHLKLFFALFAMLALGVGNAWGALTEEYSYTFTSKQFSDNSTAKKLGTVTWTPATTWSEGTGYWGNDATKGQQWGSSSNTLNKMILTSGTSFSNVKKIEINASIANSGGCKLSVKVGSTAIGTTKTLTTTATTYTFEDATGLTGAVEITLSNGSKKKAQYIKSIKIYTESSAPEKVLSSIEISGDLTDKTYEEGEELNFAGLTVTAKYDDNSEENVTDDVVWSYTPNPLTKETTDATITATYEGKTATKIINGLTVNEHVITPGTYTGNLNNVFFGCATGNNATEQSGKFNDVLVVAGCKSSASSKTYYDAGHVRFYADSYLTLSVPTGYVIKSIVFTSDGTWNGSITASAGTYTNGTKTWAGNAQEVKFSFAAQNRIKSVKVTYAADVKYAVNITTPLNGTLVVKEGSTVLIDGALVYEGTKLVVTPTPNAGYVFESLTVDGTPVDLTEGSYNLTMPAADVTISATFKENEKPAATLTLSKNGVDEDITGYKQDDKVTLPSITSDCVKEFVGWSANASCATEPEYKAGDEYTLAETAQTLYAVYATVGTGAEATAVNTLSSNGWANETKYTSLQIDANVKAAVTGGGNTGKYYTSATNWRLYQNEDATITISTTLGELKSVKFTFTNTNTGTFLYGSTTLTTGTAVEVSGTSATFTVGNSSADVTNGQIRISKIEVVYTGGVSYSNYSTTCTAAPTIYNVTIASDIQNGTVTASPTSAAEGATITLTVTPADGYMLDALTVTDANSNSVTVTDNKFTMPASDVTVSATFKENEKPAATLTLSKNGVDEDITGYKQDDKVTLPSITSDCVKEFVGWSADANCATEPEYKAGDEYTLASTTQTLYAVYATAGAGETLTITPSAVDNDAENDIHTFTIDAAGYSLTAKKNSGSSAPTFNASAKDVRIYANGTVTLTAPKALNTIVFNISTQGKKRLAPITASVGAIATQASGDATVTWTGDATEVTFTVGVNANYGSESDKAGQLCFGTIKVTTAGSYSNYSTTCAAAPIATVNPTSVTATAAETTGKLTVTYDNVNTEDVKVTLYNDAACTEAFTAGWLTVSLDGDKNVAYTVLANTLYTERKAYIQLTAPEKTGATDPDVVVIPVTQAAKEKVFASLAELVAADLTAGDEVTVTLNNDIIKEFYIYSSKRCGVVFDVQKDGKDIKIYFNSQTTIDDWAVGGKLSGTLTNVKWTTYSSAWQLAPANTWAWANLTYTEPKAVSTVVVSGAPTKTTYVDGEAFDPAGLTITVNYNDATSEVNPTGVTFAVTPATLVKGQTSVSVTATYNSVTSAAYEVTGLTVNDIPTKTVAEFIAAGGTRCYLEGIVSGLTEGNSMKYGNFDLTDASATIYVYGCLNAAGESQKFADLGVKNGDKIKVIADEYELYGGTKDEAKNVQYVSHISAASITIANITMEVGETKTIAATVVPAEAEVTYTIKENAANAISLNDNTITALAEGTATITATVAEGATYLGNSVDFTVTVGPKTESEEVVILAEHNGQWYALTAETGSSTNSLAALEVEYFNGVLYNVDEEDKASITWKRTIVGNFETFQYGDKYLKGSSSTNLFMEDGTEGKYQWDKDTHTMLIGSTKRTFLYQGTYFKNYAISNAGRTVDGTTYSALPVVTAPVYATGDVVYTRTVTNGNYGTICLPYASSNYTGMELYEVSWLKAETGLYLDQLAAGAQLVAGKPYIFRATSTEIKVTCTGDAEAAPVAGENGLTGTFTDIADGDAALLGNYIIAQNQIWVAGANTSLPAYRAYINKDDVPTNEQAKLPGRRRVCMGENTTTDIDNITNGENTTIKVIENGQLIIIRNGEKFNAQGIKL